MSTQQKQVEEFHKKFGLTINKTPTYLAYQHPDRQLRIRLIKEELTEYEDAQNEVEVADALADLLYVVLGKAVTHGIDLDYVFAEVHRSNMTKVWPDGSVHKDQYGKVIKPVTYSPADIEGVLKDL